MANKKYRAEFHRLLTALKKANPESEELDFTIDECKVEFNSGEEGLAIDLIVENSNEFNWVMTKSIQQRLSRLCDEFGVEYTGQP